MYSTHKSHVHPTYYSITLVGMMCAILLGVTASEPLFAIEHTCSFNHYTEGCPLSIYTIVSHTYIHLNIYNLHTPPAPIHNIRSLSIASNPSYIHLHTWTATLADNRHGYAHRRITICVPEQNPCALTRLSVASQKARHDIQYVLYYLGYLLC